MHRVKGMRIFKIFFVGDGHDAFRSSSSFMPIWNQSSCVSIGLGELR
jgi:hypothetical protein